MIDSGMVGTAHPTGCWTDGAMVDPKFYCISGGQGSQYWDGEWSPYPDDLQKFYSTTGLQSGHRVKVVRGTKPGDMLFATWCVISPAFHSLLIQNAATGFVSFEVPLVKGDLILAQYTGLVVHGKGGPFDPARSEADYSPSGALVGHSAVFMDSTKWDQSDVFFVPGLGISLFVSERIAMVIKRAKLKNVVITGNAELAYGTKKPLLFRR